LAALQENARIANTELAAAVGLSPAPCLRRVRALEEDGVIRKHATLVNPGAVGQPRDGDPRSAFALFDSDKSTITFYRIPYDIKAAQQKIHAADLPARLAQRLAEGH